MAWNLPALPGVGTVASVANWATKVIDSLRYLKGLDGAVTLSDGLNLGANELTVNAVEIVSAAGALSVVHGASVHTDITKTLFLPAYGYTDGTTGTRSNHHRIAFADAVARYAVIVFQVPPDFVSFTTAKAVWDSAAAAGNMYWQFQASYEAATETIGLHGDAPAYGVTATGGNGIVNVQEPANPLTLANLAIGDYVGIMMRRDAAHANDTLTDQIFYYGLLFTYTANQ